jgi:MerR family transcriptional regulator, copper efflux regulator
MKYADPEACQNLNQKSSYGLAEIRSIQQLRDGGQAPCGHVTELINEHLAETDCR